MKIKHTKTGHLKKLKNSIKSGNVKVGLPKGTDANDRKKGSESLTVVEVAYINEFGLGNVPERSFIRVPVQKNIDKYKELARSQAKKVFTGEQTTKKALGILGQFMSDKMKASFTNNNWEENAKSTVKAKGSSRPLIDIDQLRQSITWK